MIDMKKLEMSGLVMDYERAAAKMRQEITALRAENGALKDLLNRATGALEYEEDDHARLLREEATDPAHVKVKKLEWALSPTGTQAEVVMKYGVFRTDDKYIVGFIGHIHHSEVEKSDSLRKDFTNENDAKAACQADYERRIMECLE